MTVKELINQLGIIVEDMNDKGDYKLKVFEIISDGEDEDNVYNDVDAISIDNYRKEIKIYER